MSASAAPLLNGTLHPTVQPFNEASEYEKILRIRDEVFSGNHARLTVPAHALRIASSQTPLAVSQSRFNVPPPILPSASPDRGAVAHLRREEDSTQTQTKADGAPVSSSQPASNVSEFDPVLLTKSDDLVRAEFQLKRQRLEKALRDQFEHKRQDARKKPAPSEAKPDFDLPAILAKVLDATKPPSSKEDADGSDSVDANSFYSSRAPDSTPENGPQSSSAEDGEEVEAYEPPGPPVVSAVMGSPLQQAPENAVSTNNATFALAAATSSKPHPHTQPATIDLDDEEEEGEYSPPEATAQYPTPSVAQSQVMQGNLDPRNRPLRRYSELDGSWKRPISPSEANMRIVRNQITSPFAPVPSRVSPLAVAKDAPFSQNGRQRRSPRNGRAGSPTSPDDSQQPHPKKKRKLEKRNEKKARRNGRVSPDTFLKEEQVSPPPFHDVQPLGSAGRPMGSAEQPISLDEEPMQDVRYMPAPDRYVDSPSRPLPRHVEQLMPLSEPRAVSRVGLRPMRDESDLRRVASMHNMRAEGVREYADSYYDTPTRARATSYARTGSPAIREASRLVPMEYAQSPQEVRVMRSPAPVYREIYEEGEPTIRYAAEPMPPPPVERIVVDQYGRRFREVIQERPSVAPRATPVRRTEADPGYDHYRTARAGSVFIEPPPERTYTSEMPPPSVVYRRPMEVSRASVVPGAVSREYAEPGPLPRSSSVQIDRTMRSAIYPDEQSDFRDPLRMGSVRPPAMRYEESQPMEMMSRAQSVRPVMRERSVFVEGRPSVGHRYVPAEEPRYRVVEPHMRYLDAPDREMEPMDDSMVGERRIVERY
ncbi:hypothetical protein A1O1_07852 [Capronia coronata CBS 617.96]|uniref:Uncharacterized protein n=1 Tax=Capronia coronata CBS 617.96 TaxID=1182541 RepID=W9XML9_9EURO|nr:uncharacterized protein A1O1_07852 [Capronia coronata CBS 617.96]EXJ81787.1 hypothetical protein A1O1_07852 [Capronia coronata CBS 617.96]